MGGVLGVGINKFNVGGDWSLEGEIEREREKEREGSGVLGLRSVWSL